MASIVKLQFNVVLISLTHDFVAPSNHIPFRSQNIEIWVLIQPKAIAHVPILKSWIIKRILPAIQLMRPILEDHVNQRRLREGHEPETPGASGFAVLHHDAVDDLPVAGEVTLQVLL